MDSDEYQPFLIACSILIRHVEIENPTVIGYVKPQIYHSRFSLQPFEKGILAIQSRSSHPRTTIAYFEG